MHNKGIANIRFSFANSEDPEIILLSIPDATKQIWAVELFSRDSSEKITVKIKNWSNALEEVLTELHSLSKIPTENNILIIIYDFYFLTDSQVTYDIINLKLIVEWLFPGCADYELSSVLKNICCNDEQNSLQPVICSIYNKLTNDSILECITRSCLPRIQHDLALFLHWLIDNAEKYALVKSPTIYSADDHFPKNPDHLKSIIQQLFWAAEEKNNITEPSSENLDTTQPASPLIPIDVEQITSILNDTGRFSSFPGYQPRQTQIEYARQIASGLNTNTICLVEAGTGTGKTMGYCLPAMLLLASNRDQKVLIATTTKNLQSQLFFRDIPSVCSLDSTFSQIPVALLKGKANYFCLQAILHEFYRDYIVNKGSAEDQLLWLYVLRLITIPWSDMESISVTISLAFPNLTDFISRINSADHCYSDSCTFSPCMYESILLRANRSQLIVMNHHLLFYIDGYLDKPWDTLIIDESEELPSAALSCFSKIVDSRDIGEWCDKFLFGQGSISLFEAFTRQQPETGSSDSGSALSKFIQIVHGAVSSLFTKLSRLRESLSACQESETYLDSFFAYNQTVSSTISELNDELFSLYGVLNSAKFLIPPEFPKSLLSRWNTWVRDAEALCMNLSTCLNEINSRHHCVTFSNTPNQQWKIECHPLYADFLIHNSLIENRRSIIFTSASLALEEEGLEFIKEALGICHYAGEVREKQIPSPPNYYDNAIGLVYRGLKYPEFIEGTDGYEEYLAQLSEIIHFLISSAKGKTLVLFTNANKLKSVYQRLKKLLFAHEILPLIQNGSSLAEIELFKKSPAAALFGMNRFWRGVDIPGDALQQLIIVQLPRSYHLSPFWKKRQAMDPEKMERYYRNQSYFNFRQMVGRLIRKEDDSGLIILLDSRPAAHTFISNTPIKLDKWHYIDKKETLAQFITSHIR